METEIELICANLKIICKTSGNQKVYLTGSNLSEIPAGIIEKLVTECQTNGLTLIAGKEINYYAKALEEMAETGQVVLIEAMKIQIQRDVSGSDQLQRTSAASPWHNRCRDLE